MSDFQGMMDRGLTLDCALGLHQECEDKYCTCDCHGGGDGVREPTTPKQPVLV